MKNIKVNAIANLMMQVLNIIFPLITGPYIARMLNKTDYGFFNITNTFIGLFVPFATLGIYNYGIRAISKAKENKNEINRIFSLLFYISLFSTIVTTIVYFSVTFQLEGPDTLKALYYVMAIQIFAQFLNIEWMNEAFENYTFILYKTLLIRIFMLVSIFVVVKTEHDIIPYAFVMSLATLFNYLVSFLWIKREVKFISVSWKEVKSLIRPLLAILLLTNTSMLYTYLDRVFLSYITLPEFVSYYTIAQTLVLSIFSVINGAVSVSIPRLGYYLGIQDMDAYNALVNKGGRIFMFFITPLNIGLAILAGYATVLYGGEQYLGATATVFLFAIRSIPAAMEIILENQIIFVQGYENKLTAFYIVGGIINLILNSILAYFGITQPEYYILTTMFAEFFVIGLDIVFITQNNLFNLKPLFKNAAKYLLYSLGFFPIYGIISTLHPVKMVVNKALFTNIVAMIVCCVVYYVIVLAIAKDEIFWSVINSVKNKLKRN